jgi:hypothetical protein
MHSILTILALALAASIALNICAFAWIIGAIFHATQPSAEALWRWYDTAVMAAQMWADAQKIKGVVNGDLS